MKELRDFPVVGVGGSPAGVESFARLLQNVPADTGMAFVLVHTPGNPGIPVSLLADATSMPVLAGSQNTRIERNHVYVIPPNTLTRIDGSLLKVKSGAKQNGGLRPIDHFLRSLARDKKSLALGVVLAGIDAEDGVAGLQSIRAEGGIAIPGGGVGRILSPEEIGPELAKIARNLASSRPANFFADREALRDIEEVIPELLKAHPGDKPFRVWVPACAMGQAVYFIAMCVLEAMADSGIAVPVQIFGTDIDERAILFARHGVYPESDAGGLSPERRQRFLVGARDGFQVGKTIRKMCVFAQQNLAVDPPFSRLNLISCHGLLQVYREPEMQRRAIAIFHYALQPDGCLLPGPLETLAEFPGLFSPTDERHRIYRRNAPQNLRTCEKFSNKSATAAPQISINTSSAGELLERTAERIVGAEYGPAWVLVDGKFQIVTTQGDTSPYLQLAPGPVSRGLIQMARDEMRVELERLLHQVKRGDLAAAACVLHKDASGSMRTSRLDVRRISLSPVDAEGMPGETPEMGNYLVVFQPLDFRPENGHLPEPAQGVALPRGNSRELTIEQMQRELIVANRRLEAILADLDAANRELTAANEEIRSSNDELRAANQELQTSEEELQSSIEELNAVNEELHNRNHELARLGDDLENLLSSTTIPILMVDNELRIKRITPAAEGLFDVRAVDVGRPIGEIRLRLSKPDVTTLIERVIETLTGDEIELQDRENRWHVLRVRPYRTADNRIEGAVLAMIDIDQLRQAQEAAELARHFAESVIEAVQTPLLALRSNLQVRSANHAFLSAYGLERGDVESRPFSRIGGAQWKLPALDAALRRILDDESSSEYLECEQDIHRMGRRNVLIHARRIRQDGENGVLVAIQDVTAQKQAEHLMIDEQERLKRSVQLTARELLQTETALLESEDALRRSREDLRALTASLLNAQEEERRRVSRELHDDASQNMAKLQFDIEVLEHALPAPLLEEKQRLLMIRDSVGQLSNDLRRIAYALHPSTLDHLGLTVALRAYGREFSRRTNIHVNVNTARVPAKVPQEISISFYRITQEALRNMAKYSPGASVAIRLTGTKSHLTLVIQDDGPGFDREAVRGKRGLGLISMEERARLINGTFQLKTLPGHGVSITVSAPLV